MQTHNGAMLKAGLAIYYRTVSDNLFVEKKFQNIIDHRPVF